MSSDNVEPHPPKGCEQILELLGNNIGQRLACLECSQVVGGQCLKDGIEHSAYNGTAVHSKEPEEVKEYICDYHGRKCIASFKSGVCKIVKMKLNAFL